MRKKDNTEKGEVEEEQNQRDQRGVALANC
jgi:hypothetical protein